MNPMASSTSVSPSQWPTVSPKYVISNSASLVVRAAIGRDHAILAVSAAGIASLIDEGDILVRLVDASGWTLARDPQRLAGHDRVVLVRPHVELLHFVPVLRLVHWTIQIAEPRRRVELEIFGLIRRPAAVGPLRRTASAPAAGHVVANPVAIGPVARQVGMRAHPRRGHRLVDRRLRSSRKRRAGSAR